MKPRALVLADDASSSRISSTFRTTLTFIVMAAFGLSPLHYLELGFGLVLIAGCVGWGAAAQGISLGMRPMESLRRSEVAQKWIRRLAYLAYLAFACAIYWAFLEWRGRPIPNF